jgi:hypothetical protein
MSDEHKTCQGGNTLEGRYANYFEVGHNAFEFILDFGQLYAAGEKPKIHTRIVMSPVYLKTFLETLGNSLDQYERGFGAIRKEGPQPND